MSDASTVEISGRCLCGAVSFKGAAKIEAGEDIAIDACHCSMCRRWAGGPALSIHLVAEPAVEGRESLSVYQSSAWGERRFCSTCGTHLFYAAPEHGYVGVSAGVVDQTASLRLTTEIFVDCKPAYYDFANPTRRLTEAEFLAMMAGTPAKE
ncbi:MAG: GFA family protein [Hyphomicrobiaceae bacterium]|nr:GFA family protein [Hyphomicrobiaceae bacterium]